MVGIEGWVTTNTSGQNAIEEHMKMPSMPEHMLDGATVRLLSRDGDRVLSVSHLTRGAFVLVHIGPYENHEAYLIEVQHPALRERVSIPIQLKRMDTVYVIVTVATVPR